MIVFVIKKSLQKIWKGAFLYIGCTTVKWLTCNYIVLDILCIKGILRNAKNCKSNSQVLDNHSNNTLWVHKKFQIHYNHIFLMRFCNGVPYNQVHYNHTGLPMAFKFTNQSQLLCFFSYIFALAYGLCLLEWVFRNIYYLQNSGNVKVVVLNHPGLIAWLLFQRHIPDSLCVSRFRCNQMQILGPSIVRTSSSNEKRG